MTSSKQSKSRKARGTAPQSWDKIRADKQVCSRYKEVYIMKLEEKNLIVKRAYKSVYKCDDYIVNLMRLWILQE